MSSKKKITVAILEALHARPEQMDMPAEKLSHHLSLVIYPQPSDYDIDQALAKLKSKKYVVSYYDELEEEYLHITAAGRALLQSQF